MGFGRTKTLVGLEMGTVAGSLRDEEEEGACLRPPEAEAEDGLSPQVSETSSTTLISTWRASDQTWWDISASVNSLEKRKKEIINDQYRDCNLIMRN